MGVARTGKARHKEFHSVEKTHQKHFLCSNDRYKVKYLGNWILQDIKEMQDRAAYFKVSVYIPSSRTIQQI
jgi:carotenoid cleavage dioxygenase-like enzyme